jgi:hypothetical protein
MEDDTSSGEEQDPDLISEPILNMTPAEMIAE